ncbi:hypothetical protein [Aliidiomarina sanyensis]|uniref:Uncharacterized protein n=1 Tax=Aliidiomarina sanyensis TaxID=1249555 RepID=A0A432WKJ6_9GAMM|nr:hypothetical protein [Aliidiomarina sanyensis]RUO34294.1 hypothetical protein CWE11_06095 [Aliidiomarina sanyensis]
MSSNNKILRSDEEQKRSIEIYDSFRDELLKRQLSNTENYDKSILMLSSAGLAISLTFFESVVPMETASRLWLMKMSWVFFLLSILLSLVAYLVSNAAITKQLSIAEDYYVNKLQSAFNKRNWLSALNNWLNYSVGVLFAAATVAVVIFVISNINPEGAEMSDKKVETSDLQPSVESATIPIMQRVQTDGISINSAQVPTMQAAPGATSQQPSTSQPTQSQPQQSDAKK